MQYTPCVKGGKSRKNCSDSGSAVHAIAGDIRMFQAAVCGVKPGRKGYSWHDVPPWQSKVNCEECLSKLKTE